LASQILPVPTEAIIPLVAASTVAASATMFVLSLGKEINLIPGTASSLIAAFPLSETFGFGYGHAMDFQLVQVVFQFIELEGLR